MRKFLRNISIFGCVFFVCMSVLWRNMALTENQYTLMSHEANVRQQIERLDTMQGPKIMIIGGSGCGFGICSPMLREYFGMQVSNTGTHAGLGLRMQIALFEKYINEGDIVLVIPEYSQYTRQYFGDETALRILSSTYQKGYRHFSLMQQLYLFAFVPKTWSDAREALGFMFQNLTDPYAKEALNEYGDVERYEYRQHKEQEWQHETIGDILYLPFRKLKQLKTYCEAMGATMYVFPPSYSDKAYEQNEVKIDKIWSRLEQMGLPVVGTPVEYKIADTLCFDTDYHLTYEGVIWRTGKLMKDIDERLEYGMKNRAK